MTEPESRRFYWERQQFSTSGGGVVERLPAGEDLAALRRGVNRQPGTVPEMWRFYTGWQDGDAASAKLAAEHHCLTLFAVHQQSQSYLVHRSGTPLARAVRALRERFSEAAVDRRFFAAVTALEVQDVTYHLRGLVRQLHALRAPIPLDYTALYSDLAGWGDPERRSRAQRRWGQAYYAQGGDADSQETCAQVAPTLIVQGEQ